MKTKSNNQKVKPGIGGLLQKILFILILCFAAFLIYGQEFSHRNLNITPTKTGMSNSNKDSPADEFSMHWPQMPLPDGWNIGFAGSKLTDDFLCANGGYINHIRFWISWKNDEVQDIDHFSLSFWNDSFSGKSNVPGQELWSKTFFAGEFLMESMPPKPQGWFDPEMQHWVPNNTQTWFEITINITSNPFLAQLGNIYWIILDFGDLQNIGWKETEGPHFNSPCLYQSELSGSWIPVMYYLTEDGVPVDLAFVLSEEEMLNLDVTAMPDTVCSGEEVHLHASVSGGSGNYDLTWFSIPAGFEDTTNNCCPVVNPAIPTTYYAVLWDGTTWLADSAKVFVPGITCPAGWSGISTYIVPFNSEIETMLNPIFNDLIILKNLNEMYYPADSIFTLKNWDAYSGYVIKVTNKTNLPICGSEVQNKTLTLEEGWSLIPVLSHEPFDIEALFTGVEGFVIAKDAVGTGIYWKEYGINTIVDVLPGKAYYVKMNAPGSITFSILPKKSTVTKPAITIIPPSPWNTVCYTPSSHLVFFICSENPFMSGDIVGGFTRDGWCAGISGIEDINRPFALILNGDDVYSPEKEGFEVDEVLDFKLYRPITGHTFDLKVNYNPDENRGVFVSNGLSEVTSVKLVTTDLEEKGTGNFKFYPNPSSGNFTIEGTGSQIKTTIYNTFGEEIFFNELNLPAKIDLSIQPRGIYFIRIETDTKMFFEKLIIK